MGRRLSERGQPVALGLSFHVDWRFWLFGATLGALGLCAATVMGAPLRSQGGSAELNLSLAMASARLLPFEAEAVHQLVDSWGPASLGPFAARAAESPFLPGGALPVTDPAIVARLFRGEPEHGARGPQVEVVDHALRAPPRVALDGHGTLTVVVDAWSPLSGATLYVGTRAPGDAERRPRYRLQVHSPPGSADGRQLTAQLSLVPLLSPILDVPGQAAAGRGLVVWRLDVAQAGIGTPEVMEDAVAFTCAPTPCGAESRWTRVPAIRLGPAIDVVTHESAVASAWTDEPADVWVWWHLEGQRDVRWAHGEGPALRHEVVLDGLAPHSAVRYGAVAKAPDGRWSASEASAFRTAPTPGSSAAVRFAMWSDCRSAPGGADTSYGGTNRRVLEEVLRGVRARRPAFALAVGDLIDGYTTSPALFDFELEAYQRSTDAWAARFPIYEAMGNHEALFEMWEAGWAADRQGSDSAEARFAAFFVNPSNGPAPGRAGAPPYRENTYSFDWGHVHVAVVTSNYDWTSHPGRGDHPARPAGQREGWLADEVLLWLDRDLEEARRRGQRHLFVATHEPAFPSGGHARDAMYWGGEVAEVIARRDEFVRLLGKHRVAALFCGDEHNYSRLRLDGSLVPGLERPVWQIVSGGAGSPYYAQDRSVPWADRVSAFDVRPHYVWVEVQGGRVRLEAIELAGEVMDAVDL